MKPTRPRASAGSTRPTGPATSRPAKLGGDGGKVAVSGSNVQTSMGANNLVDGATYDVTVTKIIATLDDSKFTDAGGPWTTRRASPR